MSDERYNKGPFKEGDTVLTYGTIKEWNSDYGYWMVDLGDEHAAPDDYKYTGMVSAVNLKPFDVAAWNARAGAPDMAEVERLVDDAMDAAGTFGFKSTRENLLSMNAARAALLRAVRKGEGE